MKNRKILISVTIMLLLFSNIVYSQNASDIDTLISSYDIIIKSHQNNRDDRILALTTENYTENKKKIVSEYEVLINKTISERDEKLNIIRKNIQAKEEGGIKFRIKAKQQEIELLKIKEERKRLVSQEKERDDFNKKQLELEKERQELEKLRELDKQREMFAKSDKGNLYNKIKIEFDAWLNQSEMETLNDYKNRIQDESESQFENIVKQNIIKSKKRLYNIASACLISYEIENKRFLIGVNPSEYRNSNDTIKNYISVPRDIAPFLKSKFGCSNMPKRGRPILMHILDFSLNGNYWFANKVLFVFPNEQRRNSSNYYKPYYDDLYWNKTNIAVKRNDYQLEYASNISRKPLKLENILENLDGKELDNGVYYYEWSVENPNLQIQITMEDLNIKLPAL